MIRLRLVLPVALAVAGCGHAIPNSYPDLGAASDLATPPPPDLSGDMTPLPDLTRSDDSGDVTATHGALHQYVMNKLTLPQSRNDFAIDLNGDGRTDNQLGNVVGTLSSQGFDVQTPIDQAIAGGTTIYLISLQSADPSLADDDMVGVTFYAGKTHVNPDYSGAGMFTVDAATPPAKLFGRLVASHLATNNPVTTTHPVTLTIKLALFPGGAPVAFPLNGAHLQCDTATANGVAVLTKGEIHGSIKNSDVQGNIIPALARALTQLIALNPGSAQAMQIEQFFDTGGCVNPDGTMAVANDKKIDICEVATNQLIQNLLAPDVQIYDANGDYAPNPKNTVKDSLSVGLGFAAVAATFQ